MKVARLRSAHLLFLLGSRQNIVAPEVVKSRVKSSARDSLWFAQANGCANSGAAQLQHQTRVFIFLARDSHLGSGGLSL